MMSMEHSMHRMFPSNEDTRRLLHLSNLQRSSMSPDIRRDSSPQRRTLPDLSGSHQPQQQTSLKRFAYQQPDLSGNSQPPAKRLAYQQQTDLSGNSQPPAKRLAYQQQADISGNSPTQIKRLAYQQQTDLSGNSPTPAKRLAYQQQTELSGNSQPPAKRLTYQQQTDLSGNSQTQIKRLPYQQQMDLSGNNSQTQIKRLAYHQQPLPSGNAVSRRNARERKRVRLVNLGFSTLRERVPSGTKNKKLSKVETLRAAIEYIRQLQDMLGMEPDQELERMMMLGSENFVPDDCSSSEEGMVRGSGAGTSGDLSPASSHPSESSLVHYESQHVNEDQLMDIGLWFS